MQVKMEVNDLESFFLSKDKKKKSKKTYAINPSLLFEQTREAEMKKAKKVNEKIQQSQEPKSELLRKTKEDDEWEDTAEVEVDITNLRIGIMPQKVEDVKPKVENNVEVASDDSDSDSNKKVDKSAHPWGLKTVIKTDFENVVHSEPTQPQKYIAPAMRTGDGNKLVKKSAKAPNISNNAEFPSLREMADIDTEDGTWNRVTKNGHSEPVQQSESSTKKYIPPTKREPVTKENVQVVEKPKVETTNPVKYIPPHLRSKQNNASHENRFASLRDESSK